jgi:hypothetical protein
MSLDESDVAKYSTAPDLATYLGAETKIQDDPQHT